jgi:hypothetical protein
MDQGARCMDRGGPFAGPAAGSRYTRGP